MVRAVRLAATLDFEIEAETLARHRTERRAGGPPLRRARRGRAAEAARCAAPVRGPAADGRLGPARRDRPGAGPPARHRPEQDRRRGPLGATRCGPSTRRPTGRSCGWRLSCTTSASPTRSPTATSTATRPSARRWPGTSWPACTPRASSRSEWLISCATTCSPTSPSWTDAAVRRFIRKAGLGCVDDLLALRAADNEGSGQPAGAGHLAELASRVRRRAGSRTSSSARHQLAIDGNDLMSELGLSPGRLLGRLLDDLTDRVVAEPALNDRAILLDLARSYPRRQLVQNQTS